MPSGAPFANGLARLECGGSTPLCICGCPILLALPDKADLTIKTPTCSKSPRQEVELSRETRSMRTSATIISLLLFAQPVTPEYRPHGELLHVETNVSVPDNRLSYTVPAVSGALSEWTTTASFPCPSCGAMLGKLFPGRISEEDACNLVRLEETWCDRGCDWHDYLLPLTVEISVATWDS